MRVLAIMVLAMFFWLMSCTEVTEVTEVSGGGSRLVLNGEHEDNALQIQYTEPDTLVMYNTLGIDRRAVPTAISEAGTVRLELYGLRNTSIPFINPIPTVRQIITDGYYLHNGLDHERLDYLECYAIDSIHNGICDTLVYDTAVAFGDTSGMTLRRQ